MGKKGRDCEFSLVRECCEKRGLLLIEGYCYGSPVAVDDSGKRFAMIPRQKNEFRWVEFSKLRKNQKLSK
jgi:hypothetical protein